MDKNKRSSFTSEQRKKLEKEITSKLPSLSDTELSKIASGLGESLPPVQPYPHNKE